MPETQEIPDWMAESSSVVGEKSESEEGNAIPDWMAQSSSVRGDGGVATEARTTVQDQSLPGVQDGEPRPSPIAQGLGLLVGAATQILAETVSTGAQVQGDVADKLGSLAVGGVKKFDAAVAKTGLNPQELEAIKEGLSKGFSAGPNPVAFGLDVAEKVVPESIRTGTPSGAESTQLGKRLVGAFASHGINIDGILDKVESNLEAAAAFAPLASIPITGGTTAGPALVMSKVMRDAMREQNEMVRDTAFKWVSKEWIEQEWLQIETPSDTLLEKSVETVGGLAAFIVRLAITRRLMKKPLGELPPFWRGPVVWEMEAQAGGAVNGEGAAMILGLQRLAGLPIPGPIKLGIESAGFYGLAIASGGDEVDAYINAAIPFAFRAGKPISGMKKQLAKMLRGSRTPEELVENITKINEVAAEVKKANNVDPDYVPTKAEINAAVKEYIENLTVKDKKERAALKREFRQKLMSGEVKLAGGTQDEVAALDTSKRTPRGKREPLGEFVGTRKLPGTDIESGDTVRIGKGPRVWKVTGGRLDREGIPTVRIERSVPDETGEGRKTITKFAKAGRLNIIKRAADTAPFELPKPTPRPTTQAVIPKTRKRMIHALQDPRAFIIPVRIKGGGDARWQLRRADDSRVQVDQKLVQELIDDGTIVKLGKDVWGIPDANMVIERETQEQVQAEPGSPDQALLLRAKNELINKQLEVTRSRIQDVKQSETMGAVAKKLQLGKLNKAIKRLEAEQNKNVELFSKIEEELAEPSTIEPSKRRGRFFTDNLEEAEGFANAQRGNEVLFVDIKKSEVPESVLDGIRPGSKSFTLSQEQISRAQPVPRNSETGLIELPPLAKGMTRLFRGGQDTPEVTRLIEGVESKIDQQNAPLGKIGPRKPGEIRPGDKVKLKEPVPAPKGSLVNTLKLGSKFLFNVGEFRDSGPEFDKVATVIRIDKGSDGRVKSLTFKVEGEKFEGEEIGFYNDGKALDKALRTGGAKIVDPGSPVIGKITPQQANAAGKLAALMRDRDGIQAQLKKLIEVQGGKPDVNQMSGAEQAAILGPDVKGDRRTFEEARNFFTRRLDELTKKITNLSKVANVIPEAPEVKPDSLEAERADAERRIKLIDTLRQFVKKKGDDQMTEFHQTRILGGHPGGLKTFSQARVILQARIDSIDSRIKRQKAGLKAKAKVKSKEHAPKVIDRVGPEAEPVVVNEMLAPIVLGKGESQKPYKNYQQFLEDYNKGVLVYPKKIHQMLARVGRNSPEELWDFMIKDQRIRVTARPKITKKRKEARPDEEVGPPLPKEIPVSQAKTITKSGKVSFGEFPTKLTVEDIANSSSFSSSHQIELLAASDAFQRLAPHQRTVLGSLIGFGGYKQTNYLDIGKKLGLSELAVLKLEDAAILQLRKNMGVEPADATIESSFRRNNPYAHRRGMVSLYPIQAAVSAVAAGYKLMGTIIHAEAMDMIDAVRRNSGKHNRQGEIEFQRMKGVASQQKEDHGQFQPEQLKLQKRMNRAAFFRANLGVQQRPFAKKGKETKVGDMLVAGHRWSVAPIKDIVENRIKPRTDGERAVSLMLRRVALTTGKYYESDHIKLMITGLDGKRRRFTHTPGGKVFNSMPRQEMYDLLARGRTSPDGLWKSLEIGLARLNNLRPSEVRKGLEKLRAMVISNNPQVGYRHVGPEMERLFPRRPTHLRANEGPRFGGRTVAIMHTEPRAYMDQMFMSAAIRGPFTRTYGQDGKIVHKNRVQYVAGGGDPTAYDNAIRALSDVPPLLFGADFHAKVVPSPASWEYNAARGYTAGLEVVKQGLLTATAPIQLSEPVAFAASFGYRRFLKGLILGMPFSNSRKQIIDELVLHRVITQDVVSLVIDRAHFKSDFLRKSAGVLSRLHLNKAANELANEHPAGIQGWVMIREMVKRGKKGLAPTANDVYRMQELLQFEPEVARRIASGKGTSAENYEAMRRAARFAVGSTAMMSEKSPLRNTRAYRNMIPFTGFFSNRIRGLALHTKVLGEAAIKVGKAKTRDERVTALKQLWTASYNNAKFAVGLSAAGVVAQYIYETMRQGPVDAFHDQKRKFQTHPWQMLRDTFAWGTFGPLYGAFWQSMIHVLDPDEEKANLYRKVGRVILPVQQFIETLDATFGTGPYRNFSVWERFGVWADRHIPILDTGFGHEFKEVAQATTPGLIAMDWLGGVLEDPEVKNAKRQYYEFVYNPANGVMPRRGGTPAQRTSQDAKVALHLRRATDLAKEGKSPFPEYAKALLAAGGALDIESTALSHVLLERPNLNDASRRAMLREIGPKNMSILVTHDFNWKLIAATGDDVFEFGKDLKKEKNERENLILRLTTPEP